MAVPIIAIFDVGKTNKKVFFFDEQYKVVFEKSVRFDEITDEEGDPCEDLRGLSTWVRNTLSEIIKPGLFEVKAINFSSYGASLVHVDAEGNPLTPLYNYLKPYPLYLQKQFYEKYGGELKVSKETASPVLGSLNSGMQLYRLKYQMPELYHRISYSLHLPQYLSYLITGTPVSEVTSIGCHTGLWNFERNDYHDWVIKEGILDKLAPISPSDSALEVQLGNRLVVVGAGLHDSSAAFIPFITGFDEPFVLLSTGTWCISLNAFNRTPLTENELKNDCLCYMSFKGTPVKASRIFAGNEHEKQTKKIAAHFNLRDEFYQALPYNPAWASKIWTDEIATLADVDGNLAVSAFEKREIAHFGSAEDAYHQLLVDLVKMQMRSTNLVLEGTGVKQIFVDGGFSKNQKYMSLLAAAYPAMKVYAATVAQATSLGAALTLHQRWNKKPVPHCMVDLKYYPTPELAV